VCVCLTYIFLITNM